MIICIFLCVVCRYSSNGVDINTSNSSYPLHGLRMDYSNLAIPSYQPPLPHSTSHPETPSTPTNENDSTFTASTNSAVQIYPWMKKLHVSCMYQITNEIVLQVVKLAVSRPNLLCGFCLEINLTYIYHTNAQSLFYVLYNIAHHLH